MRALGCEVERVDHGVVAACGDRPEIAARANDQNVFRSCEPKTDRMQCRMAWESVHDAVEQQKLTTQS